jgi:hypothetical protein
VNSPIIASEAQFRICPLCEASRLVFSGLNEARCPACDHEPDDGFLITLRQIVDLPEVSGTSRSRPERELRARRPDPKKESDEQKGVSPED